MASLFGHVAASTALGAAFFPDTIQKKGLLLVAGFCAFAPDLDVLAFRFGVPYNSEWGHRGWTHSIVFGVVLGITAAFLCRKWGKFSTLSIWFSASAVSHPLLDMLTNGGRGVALWWPVSNERIFFPWRPITVSPLSVADFFGPWGLEVLASEILFIGLPALALVLMVRLLRARRGVQP